MCGIVGFTGNANIKVLREMMSTIVHRGPDEQGEYCGQDINLGMRRLSIIDLATGHQPVHNEDSSIWVIFNGEIYNYVELRESLISMKHKFYTDHSDTEVIVHLYEEYGLDFPNYINGMFAIALWDQNKRKLYLFRDRMGVKPLFFSFTTKQIIFASEIKAILAHPNYRKAPDFTALYHYFSFKHVPAPLTAFKGIFSLLPGENLIWFEGACIKNRWWRTDFSEKNIIFSEAKEAIRSILEDAVRLRMRSDVPYGAYLSGGIDSSAVVSFMKNLSGRRVKTFTLGYEDELENKQADIYAARKVHKIFDTEHYEYIISQKEVIKDIPDVIKSFDQPFSGTISTFFLSKLIKKHVKVALSGDGADELFGSYLSHRTAQPMAHFVRLYHRYKAGDLSEKEREVFQPATIPFLEKLYQRSCGDETSWRMALCVFNDEEKTHLLHSSFLDGCCGTTFDLMRQYFSNLSSEDSLNRILEMEWNSFFPDQVLAFIDFLSMAHSVEVRSPFLDYRLVQLAASVPGNMKITGTIVKHILKESLTEILPKEILQRPKEGFVLPIYNWMSKGLLDYCQTTLSSSCLKKHGFFNESYIAKLFDSAHMRNDYAFARIWSLVNFQIWWEAYL